MTEIKNKRDIFEERLLSEVNGPDGGNALIETWAPILDERENNVINSNNIEVETLS